jgi:hypothetical protein
VTSCLSWAAATWLGGNFATLCGRRRDGELRTSRGSSGENLGEGVKEKFGENDKFVSSPQPSSLHCREEVGAKRIIGSK